MAQLSDLSATTELDAVNQMLSAIGQSPITDFDALASTNTDVEQARNILRGICREVCSKRWKFNTEWGLQLAPEAETFEWTGTDGVVVDLNIFLPPADMLGFRVANAPSQQGTAKPDVVLRRSKLYTVEVDEEQVSVIVFYDRAKNRDGLDSTVYPYLYIDPWYLLDFVDMPETVRKYIVTRAARQFIKHAVGSGTLWQQSADDEEIAWRAMKDDQREEDKYNLLTNSAFAHAALRGRRAPSGVYDRRASPGSAA
jgi:hypothetical protein